jgi:ribosome-associated heat shock protein Hsp15
MPDPAAFPAVQSCRLDVWLCNVRLRPTRTAAAQACTSGHVRNDDQPCKPARTVRAGDVFTVWAGTHTRTVRVLALPLRRLGPAPARTCFEDLTPPEERERAARTAAQAILLRPKGSGRPTKRDRRDIDRLLPP